MLSEVHFPNLTAVDRECFPVPRCHNPRFSIDKDARKQVFHFVVNERICKVLSERTRCSFGGALYKSLGIKVMHGRIPGDFLKPSLAFQRESNSRTIHSTAVENTLTSTQNPTPFPGFSLFLPRGRKREDPENEVAQNQHSFIHSVYLPFYLIHSIYECFNVRRGDL